jgi:MscS family membrane protein
LSSSSPAAAKKSVEPDALDRDTPYGCVVGFLKAAEREEYSLAVQYLDMKASPQALERARQLRTVLNAMRGAGLDILSRTPEGDLKDGLPPTRERVGTLNLATGKFEVLLDRVQSGSRPPIWLFSSETLLDVPGAFEQVDTPDIANYIPRELREIRVFSWPLYRWLGVLLGIVIALGLATLGSRILIPLLRPLIRRVTHERDYGRLDALRAPLWLVLLALGFRTLAGLSLTALGRQFWIRWAAAMAVLGFTWLVMRISDLVADRAARRLSQVGPASKLAVLILLRRLFKIGAAIAGVVMVVYVAGGDVTAILAGIGLGGIVIALAAQKTLETFLEAWLSSLTNRSV